MTWLEALLLGIVQGATEFLPVSSSGHLALGEHVLSIQEPQLLFDIILHVGTLLSVVTFYRRDIWAILTDLVGGARDALSERALAPALEREGVRLAILIVVATIPTGALGIGLKRLLSPEDGTKLITAQIVCAILIVNGFILMLNAYFHRREEAREEPVERQGRLTAWNISWPIALVIGIAQGVAVLPGLSRSGMTITVALALWVQRDRAANYSFLLSIPAILGALVLEFDLSLFTGADASATIGIYTAGALIAAVVGYLCLILVQRVLARAQFHHFAWYCWIVGIAGLMWMWGG